MIALNSFFQRLRIGLLTDCLAPETRPSAPGFFEGCRGEVFGEGSVTQAIAKEIVNTRQIFSVYGFPIDFFRQGMRSL
jgi:hypothetical protein